MMTPVTKPPAKVFEFPAPLELHLHGDLLQDVLIPESAVVHLSTKDPALWSATSNPDNISRRIPGGLWTQRKMLAAVAEAWHEWQRELEEILVEKNRRFEKLDPKPILTFATGMDTRSGEMEIERRNLIEQINKLEKEAAAAEQRAAKKSEPDSAKLISKAAKLRNDAKLLQADSDANMLKAYNLRNLGWALLPKRDIRDKAEQGVAGDGLFSKSFKAGIENIEYPGGDGFREERCGINQWHLRRLPRDKPTQTKKEDMVLRANKVTSMFEQLKVAWDKDPASPRLSIPLPELVNGEQMHVVGDYDTRFRYTYAWTNGVQKSMS